MGNVLCKVIYKDFYLTWNVLLRYPVIVEDSKIQTKMLANVVLQVFKK